MKPTFLLIGLGNPGRQYETTRHNIGFLAVDAVAEKLGAGEWTEKPRFLSITAEGHLGGASILLVKPTTFMNNSGEAVRKLAAFYKLDAATQILVVSDDIDLPLGVTRLRLTGGAGTHNGLKSIVACVGENFPRLRIGLGSAPAQMDLAAGVLSALTAAEKKTLEASFDAVMPAVKEVMKSKKA